MVHLKKFRQAVFKKMCAETRQFLENYKIKKMDPHKKDILTKNVIGEIQKYNTGKEGNFWNALS